MMGYRRQTFDFQFPRWVSVSYKKRHDFSPSKSLVFIQFYV